MAEINQRISQVVKESGLTKTAFGKLINVSQQYISKLCNDGMPSDRTISDICKKFSISENWLRTGSGPMRVQLSRAEEVSAFLSQIMRDDEDSFRRRMISALSRLDVEEWAMLEKLANKLLAETKNAGPEGPAED